jgi:hypothetical protein
MTETIAAAAIIHNGECFAMPRPARHHTIIHAIARKVPESEWPIATWFDDQGFITSNGRYATRDEAFILAAYGGRVRCSEQFFRCVLLEA